MSMTQSRSLAQREADRIPWLDATLAYAAILPFPAALALAVIAPSRTADASAVVQIWGAALLLFFSGVRRGLSFRTPGGPTAPQMTAFAAFFCTGLLALVLPAPQGLVPVLVALAAMGAADRIAARRAEVPLYFARLRPPQMTIAVLSLSALAAIAA